MGQFDKLKEVVETVEREEFESDQDFLMKKRFGEEQKCDFFCLCGSREYKAHWNDNEIYGPGHHKWIIYYECSGCSNIFHDPKKYSEGQIRAEKRLRTAHIPI